MAWASFAGLARSANRDHGDICRVEQGRHRRGADGPESKRILSENKRNDGEGNEGVPTGSALKKA